MKFVLSFCFLITVASFISAKTIHFGKRNATDYLLYRENIIRFPVKEMVQEIYLSYPRLGDKSARKVNVTAVYVHDRFTNSSGATAMEAIPLSKSQNVRFNSAVVILRSQRSRGINSTVEFYGKETPITKSTFNPLLST